MVGYPNRTLSEKLGIKRGTRVIALAAPRDYRSLVGELPEGVTIHSRLAAGSRFVHRFAASKQELAAQFARLAKALADDGVLWISWPKQSSGVETDLNENLIREIGLGHGLVDVKVCAVDEVWSGLKFVRRVVNRK